jgi:dihydrofolate reductase
MFKGLWQLFTGEIGMRKLVVVTFMTLDGVMQAPGGPEEDPSGGFKYGGWSVPYSDDLLGETMGRQMTPAADLLLGRKTYEIFAAYWPQHADMWPGINEATKYVASTTLTKADWSHTVIFKGDVPGEIKKLKHQEGPDLKVWGSGNFVQTLLKHDLVDELWLKIYPLILGKGKRLFSEGTIPAAYTLQESKTTPSGVIIAYFKRAGEVKTGSF